MKVFYKNLNSLRFIAASMVIIHHIEQYKGFSGLPNYFFAREQHPLLGNIIFLFGKLGVDIFFVLSGFLITSLLVIEKEKYGNIAIGKFYMRRILRIWPLYFLIAALALFVWPLIQRLHVTQLPNPYDHFVANILLVVFFLPNVQMLLFRAIPYMAQSWSIGVEEQFYLVWPLIMNLTKNKDRFKKVLMWLLLGYVAVKVICFVLPMVFNGVDRIGHIPIYMSLIFQIDCMMIGALFSLLNLEPRYKKLITGKPVQIITYATVLCLTVAGITFGEIFLWEVYGFLFGIIIMNLVNSETSIVNLQFKWMDYLGKISYSMYMFHVVMVAIVIRFITTNSWLIYLLSFTFTIVISILSYEFFEKWFLRWKTSFAKIQSGTSGD